MRNLSASMSVLLILAACGGGSGDSGNPALPAAGPLQITAANYQTVAQESVSSANFLGDTAQLVTGAQVSSSPALVDIAWAQFVKLRQRFATAPRLVTGATITESQPCSGGGRIDGSLNDLNNNENIDAGESGSLVAVACVESGITINGGIAFSVTSLSGDLNSNVYTAAMTMTLTNFSAVTSAGSSLGSGVLSINLASTGLNASTLAVTVDSLSKTGSFGGVSDTLTLQNFRLNASTTPTGGGYSTSTTVSGVFSSAAFEAKTITVATVQPLVQSSASSYPASGQLTATGMNGSKARLTAQNASTVLIELDANGDDVYETSTTRLWSAIL